MGYNQMRKQEFLTMNPSAPGTTMCDLITLELLRQIILDWASAMEAHADYLTQLDVPIGDGGSKTKPSSPPWTGQPRRWRRPPAANGRCSPACRPPPLPPSGAWKPPFRWSPAVAWRCSTARPPPAIRTPEPLPAICYWIR